MLFIEDNLFLILHETQPEICAVEDVTAFIRRILKITAEVIYALVQVSGWDLPLCGIDHVAYLPHCQK